MLRYEVLGRLAVGGMAKVYLCRLAGIGLYEQLCVVKMIRSEEVESEKFIEMFLDEASISVQLQHQNIGRIFDFGQTETGHVLVMEYIDGRSLAQILAHSRTGHEMPPWAMTAFIVSKLCAALDYAHRKRNIRGQSMNIIHRDVSPNNVMITYEGEVKLIDFGIAKATQRSTFTRDTIKGKASYMSPEQASGEVLDHRSDIFSTGSLFYELLTGSKAFDGDTDLQVLKKVQRAKVQPLADLAAEVPKDLERICLRALARDRNQRYSTAAQMQEQLQTFVHGAGYGSNHLRKWMSEAFARQREEVREGIITAINRTEHPDSDSATFGGAAEGFCPGPGSYDVLRSYGVSAVAAAAIPLPD